MATNSETHSFWAGAMVLVVAIAALAWDCHETKRYKFMKEECSKVEKHE